MAQGALLPHLHEPPLQLSAASGLHALQELPLVPHWAALGGDTQLPAQQPLAQVIESQPWQCWLTQFVPFMHAAHDAPPVPHAVAAVPTWHWLFESQQPFGHEVASQVQLPFTQR